MKPIYDKRGWVLGRCVACGKLNYVEPHGTTASCTCAPAYTEHINIHEDQRANTLRYGPVYIGRLGRKQS